MVVVFIGILETVNSKIPLSTVVKPILGQVVFTGPLIMDLHMAAISQIVLLIMLEAFIGLVALVLLSILLWLIVLLRLMVEAFIGVDLQVQLENRILKDVLLILEVLHIGWVRTVMSQIAFS